MAEEIDFENRRNSNFEGLVTLTLTLDPAIRHIVLQQSSTSTYRPIPNFIQIEETFCGRTDVRTGGRTDGRTDIFPLYTIRSNFGSRPKNVGRPDAKPGIEWLHGFERRWKSELTRRVAQPLPANRAYACNSQVVNDFFDKLSEICSKLNLQTNHRIYLM